MEEKQKKLDDIQILIYSGKTRKGSEFMNRCLSFFIFHISSNKMTNKDKAIAPINTFATGDTEAAKNLLAEGYIQHNLAYGTGWDAFVSSVAYLAAALAALDEQGIQMIYNKTYMVLADGNYGLAVSEGTLRPVTMNCSE